MDETLYWLEKVFMVAGIATFLVAAMQKTVDPLKEWAEKTPNETDNKIVAWFAKVLNVFAAILQFVKLLASVVSARPAKKPLGKPTAVLLILVIVLPSCATTLQSHAKVALVTADALNAAAAVIETTAEAQETIAVQNAVTQEDAQQRVTTVRETYAPVEQAHKTARAVHKAYVEIIVKANANGQRHLDLLHIGHLFAAWQALAKEAAKLSLDQFPQTPTALEAVTGR